MAVETPARIAILGAGPAGLEAALYARFLGYQVDIYEQASVCDNVRHWGHVRMLTPLREIVTPLGLAALQAQDPQHRLPEPDELLTGNQWLECYLEPLAATDLVSDHLHLECRIVSITRAEETLDDQETQEDEADTEEELASDEETELVDAEPWESHPPFVLLLESSDGQQQRATADIVIDATGVYGVPNWIGEHNRPAEGEEALASQIYYGVPDILNRCREQYAGGHWLLVGAGCSAAAVIAQWRALLDKEPTTKVTWAVRREGDWDSTSGPILIDAADTLETRVQAARFANKTVAKGMSGLTVLAGTTVRSMAYDANGEHFAVDFIGAQAGVKWFDQIIAAVGYRPDNSFWEALAVRPVVDTTGSASEKEARRILTSEPNFYLLGAKSYGGRSQFLMSRGYLQIRRLFSIVGGRAELDLYAGASRLLR